MLALAAAALAAAPPPAVLPQFKQLPAKCPRSKAYVAATESRFDGKPISPRELTDLPPGTVYVAVLRHDENGCLDPIVIKYRVSGR